MNSQMNKILKQGHTFCSLVSKSVILIRDKPLTGVEYGILYKSCGERMYSDKRSRSRESGNIFSKKFCTKKPTKYGLPEENYHWKHFTFTMIQPKHYDGLFKHLRRSFYVDEPLNSLTGYSEEKAKDMDKLVKSCLQNDLSFCVIDNDKDEIIGSRISMLHRRYKAPEHITMRSEEMKKILPFLESIDERAQIFKKFPDVDSYVELFMASVDKYYRGQGIASEMYNVLIDFYKRKGVRLLKSTFTSPFTQKIGKNKGFREILKVRFNQYRNDEGELVFPNAGNDCCAQVGVLQI